MLFLLLLFLQRCGRLTLMNRRVTRACCALVSCSSKMWSEVPRTVTEFNSFLLNGASFKCGYGTGGRLARATGMLLNSERSSGSMRGVVLEVGVGGRCFEQSNVQRHPSTVALFCTSVVRWWSHVLASSAIPEIIFINVVPLSTPPTRSFRDIVDKCRPNFPDLDSWHTCQK